MSKAELLEIDLLETDLLETALQGQGWCKQGFRPDSAFGSGPDGWPVFRVDPMGPLGALHSLSGIVTKRLRGPLALR